MARFINSNSIKSFQQNVTASGTPEQLTAYPIPDGVTVVVKAKTANTGTITIGGTSDEALNTGTSYFPLLSGQSVGYQVSNTDDIWIDATVTGEGVDITTEF